MLKSSWAINKACSPDNILSLVYCLVFIKGSVQLCSCAAYFQASLDCHHVTIILWEGSDIVPVPQKQNLTVHTDYRPVALTSIVVKCLERIMKRLLISADS